MKKILSLVLAFILTDKGENVQTAGAGRNVQAAEASEKYGLGYNLVAGANIAGFEKVAEAMMAQGLV